MKLRALAPAKVNLSLFVGAGTSGTGRHDVATLFQSVSLADELIAEVLGGAGSDEVICPGVEGENLAARALAALRERGWDGPRLRVTIDKRIPIAAGLGGGSADAAAVLRLASAIAPGRPEEIEAIAAVLGSDVPSQLTPGVAVGSGAGDVVERFEGLAEHAVVLVPSERRLLTGDVYAELDRLGVSRSDWELANVYFLMVETAEAGERVGNDLAVNDLQAAAISLCPEISGALQAVKATGAHQVLVSGSGPTVAGIWWGDGAAGHAQAAAGAISPSFPGTVTASPVRAEFAAPTML